MIYKKSLAVITPHVQTILTHKGIKQYKSLAVITPHIQTFDARIGTIKYKDLTLATPKALYFDARKGSMQYKDLTITTPHIQTIACKKIAIKAVSHTTVNVLTLSKKVIHRPKPVTDVTDANLDKEEWDSYYYHGILMHCPHPKNPEAPIVIPLHPPTYPSNYDYECDGLPETATPPMQYVADRPEYVLHATGGLLYFDRIDGDGTQFVQYQWTYTNANHIILEELHPRIDTDIAPLGSTGYVQILCGGVGVTSVKRWTYIGGVMVLTTHYTAVFIGSTIYYMGEYQNATLTEIIKDPITGKWNLYFMGKLLASGLTLTPCNSYFILAGAIARVFITLDYFRMWLNKNRTD